MDMLNTLGGNDGGGDVALLTKESAGKHYELARGKVREWRGGRHRVLGGVPGLHNMGDIVAGF